MSPQSEKLKTNKLHKSMSPDLMSLHNKPLQSLIRPIQAMMADRKRASVAKQKMLLQAKNREYKFQMSKLSVQNMVGEITTNIQESTGNREISPKTQSAINDQAKLVNKRIFQPLQN
jgi:hypothetical protein